MIFSKALVLAAVGAANAAVVYVDGPTSYAVVTADPSQEYVTVTADSAAIQVIDSTIEETTTIYRATTKPVTLYTGTVVTILSTVEPNKVQAANTSVQVSVSAMLVPSSYTTGVSIAATPTTSSTSTTPTLAASSTLQVITTSSSSAAQSEASTVSSAASVASSTASAAATVALSSSISSESSYSSSSESTSSSSSESTSSSSTSSAAASTSASSGSIYSEGTNLFNCISADAPPSVFSSQDLDITLYGAPTGSPIHTNKFYTNLILENQTYPAYVQPYSVWWSKLEAFPGFGISHTNASQRVYGPDASANPVEYYINPVGLISLAFSATGITSDGMSLSVSNMDTFSALVTLSGNSGTIEFPLVQGMGFITAKYDGTLTPEIYSQLGIDTFVKYPTVSTYVQKYVATLFNGISWVVYVTVPEDATDFALSVNSTSGAIVGSSNAAVVIQVASAPDNSQTSYDEAAGMYPVSASISGSVGGGSTATYSIDFATNGSSVGGTTLMMALPHHVDSFTSNCANTATSITLDSTTKGTMTGYLTNSFEFLESLNQDIQFLPWSAASAFGSGLSFSAEALQKMATAANSEITSDFGSATDLDSTYFSGKALDKYAYILLVLSDILESTDVTSDVLERIKTAFSTFTSNTQQVPLMYDTLVKGITSTGAQNGDSSLDFGSPYYNDHHFHYGYFIHAAAVVAHVDLKAGGTWGADNAAWVNALVRDVANPSSEDSYFPVFRSFDWFSGHSWAKGLFASSDGKDEESSSEDYNFAYGMKLWGNVIGDASMEARGDLMLSVMRRAMDKYFYMKSDNTVQPSNFIANKVPGITFENKLDYTTYFGTNVEYIHGIHMIPVTPVSSYLRTPAFVEEEWTDIIASLVDNVDSGWKGILKSNQALYDPVSAYSFFAQDDFDSTWLDGGASLTWYLAFSAGVGGSQA